MSTTILRRLAVHAAACALLLSACGSDTESAAKVPSLDGSGGSGAASVTTTTVDAEQAAQDFVTCLREQGLEVADPKVGSDGNVDMRSIFESAGLDPGNEDMRTAMDSCRDELGNAGFGPSEADREERQQAMLAFTSCLRDQGLEVGDLSFDGPGGGGGGFGPPPGSDSEAGGGALPGRSTDGSTTDGSTTDGSAPTPPQRPGGSFSEEDRNRMLAERLDLDPDDAAVTAAFSACSDTLADLGGPGGRGGPGGTTTTTEG